MIIAMTYYYNCILGIDKESNCIIVGAKRIQLFSYPEQPSTQIARNNDFVATINDN